MDAKLILFAVPVFFLFTAWEMLAARKSGRTLYRAGDTFANLSSGLGSQRIAAVTAPERKTKHTAFASLLALLFVATVTSNAVAEVGGPVAEEPQSALAPKLDAEGLRQLGPEHLQLIYCGAKEALARMPENRKRLERLATEQGTKGLFDKRGKAETSKMLDKSETEARRIAKDSAREYRAKAKKKISDEPCAAYSAAIQRPNSPAEAACHARYRMQLAEKLENEVRSPAVASDFRERFREKLARDLEGARQQLQQAEAGAKSADATFDPTNCRFDKGIRYEARRVGS